MTNNDLLLSVKDLSYKYSSSSQLALDNVSFCVHQGDYIGLIGPNGGGKTTLIKIILGLIADASLAANMSFSLKPGDIGYVPQRASQNLFNFPATVKEIISSGLVKTSPKSDLNWAIKVTEISHLENKLITNLSGGELQKVLIARALVSKPKLLVLDEPIVGVDTPSQTNFYKFLKKLNQEQNIAIVFVSHDVDVISKQATRVFCLNKKLVQHNHPSDLLKDETIEQIFGKDYHLLHHHNH